jgi:integrase
MPRAKSRGIGKVYRKEGSPFWYIRYQWRGVRHNESSKSVLHQDAVDLLEKRIAEIASGQAPGRKAEAVTFADLQDLIEADYAANRLKSVATMRQRCQHLRRVLKDCPPVQITKARLQQYVETRVEEGAAPATVQYELRILSRMFTLAVPDLLQVRPKFPTIRVENARAGFFEDDEITAVVKHLPDWFTPMVLFLAYTGWRAGEARGLRWKDVDFKAGSIRLDPGTTKNREGRFFPLAAHPALESLLRAQDARTREFEHDHGKVVAWVFHRAGGQISPDYRHWWKAACKEAGLPGKLLHDLRRSAVRRLEQANVPRSVAMKITGHKTENIYKRYAIVDETDIVAGVRRIADRQAFGSETVQNSRPVR